LSLKPKKLLFILLPMLLATGSVVAQEKNIPASLDDPICGFIGKHFYLKAAAVRQGLAVDFLVGYVEAGQTTSLRFFVNQKPRGFPVDDLQVEHEKLIHVIGVREDLGGFFHIHPVKVGPGLWAVDHVFTNAGVYQIWSDVKYRGVSYSFAHSRIVVPGKVDQAEKQMNANKAVSRYRISLKQPDIMIAGQTNRLELSILDKAGERVRTENFLGAAMHLIIVKDDLSIFLHAHPDNHTAIATNVYFSQVFPASGRYKLFVQYRPEASDLPRDEAFLEELFVRVGKEISRTSQRYESRP
jgi:hypothetical protein